MLREQIVTEIMSGAPAAQDIAETIYRRTGENHLTPESTDAVNNEPDGSVSVTPHGHDSRRSRGQGDLGLVDRAIAAERERCVRDFAASAYRRN